MCARNFGLCACLRAVLFYVLLICVCAQFCVCVVLLCVCVRGFLQFCFMCAFDLCVRAILFGVCMCVRVICFMCVHV